MGWPQITLIALMAASFAICLAKAGDTRTYNPFTNAIDAALFSWLLWEGGFWG